MDQVPISNIVANISKCFNSIKPEIVYLPNPSDIHTDHQIAFKAAFSCTKSFRFPSINKVMIYETLSETEYCSGIEGEIFKPNTYINISDFIEKKLSIMDIYADQLGAHPFPRSKKNITAIATTRGATSNCEYAEAFNLIKYID